MGQNPGQYWQGRYRAVCVMGGPESKCERDGTINWIRIFEKILGHLRKINDCSWHISAWVLAGQRLANCFPGEQIIRLKIGGMGTCAKELVRWRSSVKLVLVLEWKLCLWQWEGRMAPPSTMRRRMLLPQVPTQKKPAGGHHVLMPSRVQLRLRTLPSHSSKLHQAQASVTSIRRL